MVVVVVVVCVCGGGEDAQMYGETAPSAICLC